MQINLQSGSRAGPVKSLAAASNLAAQEVPRQRFTPVADTAYGSRTGVLGMSVWIYLAACVSALLLLAPPAQAFFAAAGMRWAYILSMSFCLSFSLTPLAALIARRCGILDVPDARKLHGRPTPLLGGAAVFVGFAASLLANAILVPELVAILTGAMILFVVGVFLFSGSLYALCLTGVRSLGAITPLGGAAFIAGWLLLAWGAWRGDA